MNSDNFSLWQTEEKGNEELTLKEIGEVLEINLNTVKAKLYRGLKQLRVNMQEVDV